jgi:Cd2+/Zn2+-exporting ATPase
LLVSGAIYINVTEKYENSTVNKLKKAIEQAEKRKSAREKKISRFASVFTPIAFGAAVAVFALCLLLGRGFTASFKTSLVVLVASCPCSLVLSVPLAYFSCIGRAAKRGIVFRGGQTIDNVEKIETVILDKTGTLTSSRPEFIGILLPKDPPVQKVVALDYAKAALLKSPHALAGVFCEKYTETVSYHAEGVKIIGGRGLGCLIGGKKVALGNKKLMDEIGVKVDEVDKSVIYLSVDGEYCAALLFDAKLKENALMEVSALRANGVKRVAIMSGDTAKTVKSVADEVGVDEFYAELKPDEKLRRLEYIYNEGKRSSPCGTLAFCGDGLNDSAAIARADVGVAMGSGSAFTLESADVVIVDDNLERLNDMIRMARKTSAIVNANIMISLGIKLAVVIAGVAGYPFMGLAVVADVGAAVVTVLNSVRAGKI